MKEIRYIIHIRTSGLIELCPLGEVPLSVVALQSLVSGGIETVPAKHGTLVVNRDHKLDALPFNDTATSLLRSDVRDLIRGDAVLCATEGERLVGFHADRAQRIIDSLVEGVDDDE